MKGVNYVEPVVILTAAVLVGGIIAPLALTAAFWPHLPTLAVYFIIMMDEVIKVPVALWYFRRYSRAQNLTR